MKHNFAICLIKSQRKDIIVFVGILDLGSGKMKAAVFTLGCKVNQYESEEMCEALTGAGFLVVDAKEDADVYIVNSCTVTAESTRKTRQAVRRFKALHPNAAVVLTGCVPQAFPNDALSIHEADIILGNKNNHMLISALNEWLKKKENIVNISPHETSRGEKYRGSLINEFSGHTRAFMKIQDGCDRFCSYCAIPSARGRSRSKPLSDIKTELENLASGGFKEVVFVGINLSAYGRDLGLSLSDAVFAAQNTRGIERIRLGSLEPDHITDNMISDFASCSKFCPQFHISLQSGSDGVLKRMNRHYTASEYETLVNKLRSSFDGAAITTDIITGFPGETDEEFGETLEFVRRIRFEKIHVFPFSVREGTKAAEMEDKIPNSVKNERAAALSALAEEIRSEYFTSLIGKTVSVLFEKPKNGYQHGYTASYTPVKVKYDNPLTGTTASVKITGCDDDGCVGTI